KDAFGLTSDVFRVDDVMIGEDDILRNEEARTGPVAVLSFVICPARLDFADRRGPRRRHVEEPCREYVVLADNDLETARITSNGGDKLFLRQSASPAHICRAH